MLLYLNVAQTSVIHCHGFSSLDASVRVVWCGSWSVSVSVSVSLSHTYTLGRDDDNRQQLSPTWVAAAVIRPLEIGSAAICMLTPHGDNWKAPDMLGIMVSILHVYILYMYYLNMTVWTHMLGGEKHWSAGCITRERATQCRRWPSAVGSSCAVRSQEDLLLSSRLLKISHLANWVLLPTLKWLELKLATLPCQPSN